ncbi:site-specific integrase [Shewanella sp. SM32]|uniref:site-specific integrase n=1 Tax=Shewanella sp. SM32 TaxID=2912796 RepID=UPI0021DADF37|nr:site-specific integrase [Shewanella sp. SM32]MCU8071572.1 site-specific integrase [Shewanella sp. SM32]
MSRAAIKYLPDTQPDVYQYMYDEVIRLNDDCDPIPQQITTFFGQAVTLRKSDGYLNTKLRIVNLGKDANRYELKEAYCKYPYLNYISIQCWISAAIDRTPASLNHLGVGLKSLSAITLSDKALSDESTFSKEIATQLSSLILTNADDQRIWMSVRIFANFAIEMGFWGFDERLIFKLDEVAIRDRNQKLRVSLLDHDHGPFTRSEIAEISQALHRPDVSIRERVLIKLAMQFGLRPIQIGLLRESDIYYDSKLLVWFINIPRVKGKVAQLRRNANNFVTRELPEELAAEIQTLIKKDSGSEQLNLDGHPLPRPLIKRKNPNSNLLKHPVLKEYGWHEMSASLSRKFKDLGRKLKIISQHVVDEKGEPTLLNLHCYRFRYTLGTRMVMEGKTPEEIAIALDHSSTASVEHYFRYNRDLIDFIDDTFDSSSALKNAVARWQGFLISENDQIAGSLVKISDIASLGKCLKQTRCDMHPTISCYSCTRFRPFINADHEAQLKVIEAERAFLQNSSSGPVKHQLDEAWIGAVQIVEAQKTLRGNQ